MSIAALPWLEATLILPLVGALITAAIRTPPVAARVSFGFLLSVLVTATAAAASHSGATTGLTQLYLVDDLSAPMLPVLAVLHLLTLLGTAKARVSSLFCVRLLLAVFISLAAVTCHVGGVLVVLLVLGVLLPLWDLRSRGSRVRGYVLHMSLMAALLLVGFHLVESQRQSWGFGLMLLALLLRGGIVPLHGWLPSLFEGAAYGTAMLFVLPLMEVLAALRLLLPLTPAWMLNAASVACLITAVYGGGMAIVQTDVRRFYAHLCMSQTSLVMFAVMLHTSNGLTAALCMWASSSLSLAGLAFTVRALEARFGALSLRDYHGYYEQVPGLAVCFLATGLASVGFPGTIGFVPMELLISGSAEQGLWVSTLLAVAATFNGVAIMRAYFALFTGKRSTTSVSLRATRIERAGIVLIALIVFMGGWLSPQLVASRHDTAARLLERATFLGTDP